MNKDNNKDNNKDISVYKTSRGKIFRLLDSAGNPIDAAERRNYFNRSMVAMLEVGQHLKHGETGVTLERIA